MHLPRDFRKLRQSKPLPIIKIDPAIPAIAPSHPHIMSRHMFSSASASSTTFPDTLRALLRRDVFPRSSNGGSRSAMREGFSPAALGGIFAGIAILVMLVIILGIMMRRSKRRTHHRVLLEKTSSPTQHDGSLRGIIVTKDVETTVLPVKLHTVEGRRQSHIPFRSK
ncbi:uncharacterized protein EI97DRAFT_433181 [Westerdykella ornata]|uniref:Uncharacterized protein n=1 Tax=Westerdykella ornata TaxID=318751 RepID=A0A6A6JJN6_WESOR|nr:uncharacterized protein EI97DRAFT_433181 [Westerdykella ornata]KAF2276343.1 hypothetical protein EI97DRAFT_433181 [Westerdykella ornata]